MIISAHECRNNEKVNEIVLVGAIETLHMISLCYLQISLAGQTRFFLHVLKKTTIALLFFKEGYSSNILRALWTCSFFSVFNESQWLFWPLSRFPMLCRCAVIKSKGAHSPRTCPRLRAKTFSSCKHGVSRAESCRGVAAESGPSSAFNMFHKHMGNSSCLV